MPRKASYGYGYGQTSQDLMQLRNVNVPQKLKCHYCNKNYNQANFSKKQLDDVRLQIQTSGKIVQNPKCNKCTGARVFELECVMCHKTKGEKEFSKTQRKVPDDATCYACIELQVKQEPVNEEDYEDPSRAFLTGLHSQGNYPDYFAPKALPKDSIDEYGQYASTNTYDSKPGGGVSLTSLHEALIDAEYDPPEKPNNPWKEGAKSYQTTSNAASNARTMADISNKSTAADQSNRSGFAKIKAYKPEEETSTPFDDSDSESDDYDSDDDDDDAVI